RKMSGMALMVREQAHSLTDKSVSNRRADVWKSSWSLASCRVAMLWLTLLGLSCLRVGADAPTNLLHVGNSTLRMPSQSQQALSYRVGDMFPGLSFEMPVAVVSPQDDTNRLFGVERTGRIVVITNLANPSR